MNQRIIITLLLLIACIMPAMAQFDADTDNGVVSLAGRDGFSISSKNGAFEFRPYLLVQGAANFNYYDSEGLDAAYNQDNVANSGFSIPYAVLGFTGHAFKIVNFNLSINAAASGGALLQQAWADVAPRPEFGVRFGKFKTPFSHAYLTALGSTLFPSLPRSLTTPVILPYSLNAVTPSIGTGFDLGVEVHGLVKNRFGYQVGIFNGTGASVNTAGKTFSDDWHIPSLLYAARLTWQPQGPMPAIQGSPAYTSLDKMLIGVSSSLNVESENESTNDFRLGAEWAWNHRRLYLGAEAYWMHVGFTKRQKIDRSFNYFGGYLQAGYFVTDRLQPALRYELFDRNGSDRKGLLNIPSVGLNYFFPDLGIKLQAMYSYTARKGHANQSDRDEDNLGLSTHQAMVMVQYSF
ncbi:MAG: OprO/OprP family phosphate-selective porin [Pseudoflavonifractor sp.]|nr:OprO/OprP family phosphate-selective porin [Alloprevotella sp.]MCM1116895.1 OprO/OprP family phosphate-selective porin [Pseudoflavonifractor sp.]